MMALSATSGRTCRFTLGLLIFTGCCCGFVRAQTGNRYGLDPTTIQNPFYSNIPTNTYSNNYNGYYNRNPSQGYYGNYPGYNYNYNYYPATTTPPPPTYLPANTAAPNPAASAGGGGGETEAEDAVSTTGEATQTGSGYYGRQVIPASSGTRLPLYGDWNPPIGSVFGSGRVGLLESRAPYYNYNNNYNNNNNNYGYGYAQQQQNNWNPFMTMMAFDMW